ncbi:MAG: aspartate--tRNA(Asn) ligase [Candidatus Bathyarchaeum sp.]|nr:MAG: aspartate--tRNA(Asn) ligase [Candidatus Bathyarchaeum sp.]
MIEKIGDWERSHYSKQLNAEMDSQQAIVMGWVRELRDLGKVKFIKLADREGFVQIIVKKDMDEEILKKFKELGREDVIAVKGTVKASKMAPNGVEILPSEIRILNVSERPLPLELETRKTPAELVTRLNSRFLDLRKHEVAAIFCISDSLKRSFFDYFKTQGFIDLNTPIIVEAAAEGGATLFALDYFGKEAYLNQSPQLYKQMVLASGFDKVNIISRVFRAEPHDTPRHLNELVQMDAEQAFIRSEEDVLKHFDGYLQYAIENLNKNCAEQLKLIDFKIEGLTFPIKRLPYDEALDELKKVGIELKWGEDLTPEAEKKLCELYNPVLITKWPSSVKPFYCMKEDDPKYSKGFDLLLNGTEISSGAQREHRYEELVKNLKEKGLDPVDFEFYLNAFKFGMPPHGGWSIGLERLTMTLLKLANIKEASLFPRTKERLIP